MAAGRIRLEHLFGQLLNHLVALLPRQAFDVEDLAGVEIQRLPGGFPMHPDHRVEGRWAVAVFHVQQRLRARTAAVGKGAVTSRQ